ncbi:MAG: alpha-methylacyl-CoA racemase [Candidatus Poriferisodalaceae bacterium]|jgi:alpha-methylacyl-CoA racemase|tara:strand:- start:4276 stop:5421 length:1146 start_codon:yes stop_codon:yes gene_type:complete
MGPLEGVKIVELQGIGPGPFCGMMLSDMGAEVIRIDRAGNVAEQNPASAPIDVLARGRSSIGIDLKNPGGVEVVMKIIETADGLIEGFRPGVMERLGLGPEECLERNPKLVYGRMTGWGQEGPYSMAAGHDINYIALAGALEPIGRKGEAPVPPLNLVGDFGGGGMLLAFGMVCGIIESRKSGSGQVVDAAMVDGAATLMAMFHSMRAMGVWNDERGTNLLDTGSHFYDVYECSDGLYISIGSIEPQFYSELMRLTGLTEDEEFQRQMEREAWPNLKERITEVFKSKSRDEWCTIMEGTDVCFAPVLTLEEAPKHPHNVQRDVFTEIEGVTQPNPSPRFSRTTPSIQGPPAHAGKDTNLILKSLGFDASGIQNLREDGAVA